MSGRITTLVPGPIPGQAPDASLIAVDNGRGLRASVYLARPTSSYQGIRWDPVPMPAEIHAHLTAAGLFLPA